MVYCSLLFSLQPRTFAMEATKVAYTISHLTGWAWLRGTTEWKRHSETCSTFSMFAAELRKVFGLGNSRASVSAVGAPPGREVCLIIPLTAAHWPTGANGALLC